MKPTTSLPIGLLTACIFVISSPLGRAQCGAPSAIGGAGGSTRGIDVEGDYAYVVEHGRLTTFDISDPTSPVAAGTVLVSANFLWDVSVSNGIAACADAFWGVRFVDVSEPTAPRYLSVADTPYGPEGVANGGDYVYAADGRWSVQVIDASDPNAPVLVGSVMTSIGGTNFYAQTVIKAGDRLYVGGEAFNRLGIFVIDVSVPTSPALLGSFQLILSGSLGFGDLTVLGTNVYFTDRLLGLHVIDVSNPALPVETASLSGFLWSGVEPFGNHLLVGGRSTVNVVDVSNPVAPSVVATLPLTGDVDGIAVVGDYALLATSDAGLVTLDVSTPSAPVIVGLPGTPEDPHAVAIANGIAYIADGAFGLKVMDLANPMVPTRLGVAGTPGSATGIALDNNLAYIADGSSGLQIIDVSVPSQPVLVGGLDTLGTAVEVALDGNGLAFIADGPRGLSVMDVSNPLAPISLATLSFPGANSFATAVYLDGSFAYLTDDFHGLRIVDVSDPTAPFIRSTTDTSSHANDVIVDFPFAYVADYSTRLNVMDVTDPDAPVVLWTGPINSSGKKLLLVGNKIYLSQNQGGYFETYDVTNPAAPVPLYSISAPTLGDGLAHEAGILVVAHWKNGLRTFRTDSAPHVLDAVSPASCYGNDATLHVPATGQTINSGVVLDYQWRKSGVPLVDGPTGTGSIIEGATTGVLKVISATLTDVDQYDCIVSNVCSSVQSGPTSLILDLGACSDSYPSLCNGDGGNQLGCTACPCGNDAAVGTVGGCINSAGKSASLLASGDASVSLLPGVDTDLRLALSGAPAGALCVMLSGNAVAPQNMNNACFGMNSGVQALDRDGLRCAVMSTKRHGGRSADALGDITSSTGPSRVWGGEAQPNGGLWKQGGFVAGQTRYFQVTYRENAMAVCMRGLNTSQAVRVVFTP